MSKWSLVIFIMAMARCSPDDDCPTGAEACSCTAGGGCDPGLVCLSTVCVRLAGGDPLAGDPGPGGGDSGATCNPVANTGCPSEEKCTFIVDSQTPSEGHTGCTADGSVVLGGSCTHDSGTGTDNCRGPGFCLNQICTATCTVTPDSCAPGWSCQTYSSLFEANVGLCGFLCDPVTQNCGGAEACYLQAVSGQAGCAAVPADAEGRVQDDPCYGPDPDRCHLNGCDEGHGANLPDNTCAFFCNPVDNWSGNVLGLAGDPAGVTCAATFGGARPNGPGAGYECRFFQTFYAAASAVAADTGMCVSTADYRTCADFDWTTRQADDTSGASNAVDYCDNHPDRCTRGCLSLATMNP